MKNRTSNWNIPNALSVFRILLIAPFAACFLTGHYLPAWILLLASGASDFLDGKIARKRNQITELGKILDPIADKLTQGVVAACMAVAQPILMPLLAIFVGKELLMLLAGLILLNRKKLPCAAKWYGKAATCLFYVSFITIFALGAIWHYESLTVTVSLLSVTAGFMIYAFIRYFQVFVHILRSRDPKDPLSFRLRKRPNRPKHPTRARQFAQRHAGSIQQAKMRLLKKQKMPVNSKQSS